MNSEEFLKGQQDCKAGNAHKNGQSESYERGYSAQYEIEQLLTHKTSKNYETNRTR